MGNAWETGVIEAPADGKVAWTAHADLAEAAAIMLADTFATGAARYDGPTPPLTGSQALDLADLAAIASALLDRPVARKAITDESFQAAMAARGTPDRIIAIAAGLYVASRAGEFAITDPTLGRVLGRHPIGMRELIAQKLGGQRG